MLFKFPLKKVIEGITHFFVPDTGDSSPSSMIVFYNPVMEFSRDISIIAIQAYQKIIEKEISICEPLTGSGIRGTRYANEVEQVKRVILSDINSVAVKLTQKNIKINKLEEKVFVEHKDANLILSEHAKRGKRFNVIDIDPFGSPAPFLDSAVRAVSGKNGLLAITATDMPPLCGLFPETCARKYGAYSLRTEYCHEIGVRILAGALARIAARHGLAISICFCHSTNHYIRIFAMTNIGKKKADRSIKKIGYISHCFKCGYRTLNQGIISKIPRECSNCGHNLDTAGPLWLGEIFDKEFVEKIINELSEKKLRTKRRVKKILELIHEELQGPPTYIDLHKYYKKLKEPIPPIRSVIKKLRKEGYIATRTHFNPRAIRTNSDDFFYHTGG